MIVSRVATMTTLTADTIISIENTWAWLGGIPIIGPILAAIASAAIAVFAAIQAANVLGVSLAEGGIVGHGSRGPQVSPLPQGGLVQFVNVRIDGGLSGTEAEAEMIAQLIHREQA